MSRPTPSHARVARSLRPNTATMRKRQHDEQQQRRGHRRQEEVIEERVQGDREEEARARTRPGRGPDRGDGRRGPWSGWRRGPWPRRAASRCRTHARSRGARRRSGSERRYSRFSTRPKPVPTAKPRMAASTRKPMRPRRTSQRTYAAFKPSSIRGRQVAGDDGRSSRAASASARVQDRRREAPCAAPTRRAARTARPVTSLKLSMNKSATRKARAGSRAMATLTNRFGLREELQGHHVLVAQRGRRPRKRERIPGTGSGRAARAC